jgi:hypothetical protein
MRARRDELKLACEEYPPQPSIVKAKLLKYTKALEQSRFLEAQRFLELVATHGALKIELSDILKKTGDRPDPDECVILYYMAVAHAQRDEWSDALDVLERKLFQTDRIQEGV